jgi:hypothetical protein
MACAYKSDHFGSCVNTGLHLAQLGDACGAPVLTWVRLRPDSVAAQANLGLIAGLGRFETALGHYNRLIGYPDVVEYRWNRGIALLSHGDFANGWNDYEHRHARAGKWFARRFPLAEWDGTALSGRHILIYGEQGVGDEIMFASCVSDVLRRAEGVVIECDRRLAPLFRRSFPAARVHGAARVSQRDWLNISRAQLADRRRKFAAVFRRNQSDFPQHDGYLVADAARRAHWQTRLAALGGGLKIGIGTAARSIRGANCARSHSLPAVIAAKRL